MLYIRNDNNAMIHSTDEKIARVQKLPLTVLESKQSTCCFVFGAQAKYKDLPALKVDNEQPLLSSSRDEETYQFLGAYRPAVAEKADNRLAFGMVGMRGARLVGNDTYEVMFANTATPPVFVRHCLGSEGVNFMLYHALNDKKPYIRYYYYFGYEIEANCPAMP